MRKEMGKAYMEIALEFNAMDLPGKVHMLAELDVDGLKTMLEGAKSAPDGAYIKKWIGFLADTIERKTAARRESRLEELGI